MANSNLHKAKKAKNDEFYTDLSDIEREMIHYRDQFKGKHIFLNCDDPEDSHFWKYFELNFQFLGLKQLTATHFDSENPTYRLDIYGDTNGDGIVDRLDIIKTPLKENGDFRSSESLDVLVQCDIVVTNPPFSLFREYMEVLQNSGKEFLIIGSMNAITYKETFQYIREDKLWLGTQRVPTFRLPDGSIKAVASIWFTNMNHKRRNEELVLVQEYTPEAYPSYDNYNAININKVKDIPKDYKKAMGVPITFLTKYNPDQFEILNANDYRSNSKTPYKSHGLVKDKDSTVEGKAKYARILIRSKGDK